MDFHSLTFDALKQHILKLMIRAGGDLFDFKNVPEEDFCI